jgi:hypothetical protein
MRRLPGHRSDRCAVVAHNNSQREREPPICTAHEREFAAVAAVHKQVLCIAAGQSSEQAGRQGVHCESLRVTFGGCGAGRLKEDAGVVDNSVHPADLVHLAGEVPGPGCAGQVADDDARGVRAEIAERRRPLASAGVEDNVMAFTDEDTGGARPSPSVQPVMKIRGTG